MAKTTTPVIVRPSIDWRDTEPPMFPATGCKVLWNDRQRIFDYFLRDRDADTWHMKSADEVFKDVRVGGTTAFSILRWRDEEKTPGRSSQHGDRQQYQGYFDTYMNQVLDRHFVGTHGFWPPEYLDEWKDVPGFEDGVTGYGEFWRWTWGNLQCSWFTDACYY